MESDLDLLMPPGDQEGNPPLLTVEDPQGPPPVFEPEAFERFCLQLRIDSKELGRVPLRFLRSQRYLIQKIAEGLSNGIHTFVVLKGRQIGISTVLLALDIYWMLKFKGLQGAIVTDTDENKEVFRANVALMIASLPPKARAQVNRHNRVQLICKTGSRFIYMCAGSKKNGGLGRAKSANFMHGTECSSWGDEEGFGSLVNTLAQKNPNRLYVLESTARGYNMFYQTWEVAKEASDQAAIFIGWWLNELYSWDADSAEYREFWDGELTSDERVWVKDIYERYQVEITPEQLAWWRWYVKVQMKGDEMHALQEMPPTEEYAFQLSGSRFFSSERVNAAYSIAITRECLYFKYVFGLNFEDTQFTETDAANAEVYVYETPVKAVNVGDPEGCYALGADPAYGSSEWADFFAGSMLRCYADKVVQVAEVGATEWTDIQFAWVLAHMAGWYGNTMLNLEMQGPGGAVYNELWNLKKRAGMFPQGDPRAGAFDVVGRVRDYLWKRQDTLHGNFAYQWQTNHKEKVRLMSTLRSYWERGSIEVASPRCIQQFRNIHRTGDQISGEGRAKDDFVIALAIGTIAWNDWLMLELLNQGRTYAHEHRPAEKLQPYTPVEKSVVNYLRQQGINFRGMGAK